MRLFKALALGLACVVCVVAPVHGQAPQLEPVFVARTQPLGDVLALIKSSALAAFPGQSDEAQQLRSQIELGWNAFIGERGKQLLGVDPARPLCAYSYLPDEKGWTALAVPIADERLFRDWLGNLGVQFKPQGDLFDVSLPGTPDGNVQVRFAEKYAHFHMGEKLPAGGPNAAATAKVLAKAASQPIVCEFIPARASEMLKLASQRMEDQLEADSQRRPDEEEGAFASRRAGAKWAAGMFKSLLLDMELITFTIDIPKGDRLVQTLICKPKPGTSPAKLAAIKSQTAFGPVAMPGKPLGAMALSGPLCDTLKKLLAEGAANAARDAAAKGNEKATEIHQLLVTHLLAAPLDLSILGSATETNPTPTYCVRLGLVDGAKFETALLAKWAEGPAEAKELLQVDVAKVGAQRVHAFKLPAAVGESYQPGAMKRFAELPVYFAITPQAFMAVGGADGKATLEKALAAKPPAASAASQLSYELHMGPMLSFVAATDASLEKLPARLTAVRQAYAGKFDSISTTVATGSEGITFTQEISLAGVGMFVQYIQMQLEEVFSGVGRELGTPQ